MAGNVPKTQRQWVIENSGPSAKMSIVEVGVPSVGAEDVLIKMKALSLNYRDLLVENGGYNAFERLPPKVIPISDGAGEIVAVGDAVTRFKVGDKVTPIFTPGRLAGALPNGRPSLGAGIDGIASEYVAFNEQDVVAIPEKYSYEQAATLPCAAVTAWNALFGLTGRTLTPGDWVLTQGTGGVSLFAVQIAKATGARVVATTSSDSKAKHLRALGADHIINYRTDEKWGETARKLTGGRGFDHIIEVGGGEDTVPQSLDAIASEGVISVIGMLDTVTDKSKLTAEQEKARQERIKKTMIGSSLVYNCIIRGIRIGSRVEAENLVKAINGVGFEPVIDEQVFGFEQLKEAYRHLESQKHVGKVVISYSK